MQILYEKTKSFCPVCNKILATDIQEKEGAIWMEKSCPQHGTFKEKIAKYAWHYKGLNSFRNNLFRDFYKEKRPTAIYTTSITSKCNLNCPICFANNVNWRLKDLPMDFFKNELEKIKNKNLRILFSGGEPTLREDLPEMIKTVKESGNSSTILTNGVKIAHNFAYLKLLKKQGLNAVYVSLDTINNPEIHKKMRGQDLTNLKMKAIENVKKLNISLRIFAVAAKDVNESEINDLIEFSRKEKKISALNIRGYSHLGENAKSFSHKQEFLMDELLESVAKESGNLFSLEDIYYHQKLHLAFSAVRGKIPICSKAAMLFIPRKKKKMLHQIFKYDKFSKVLDEFGKIWQEDKKRAKRYLLLKCAPTLITSPDFFHIWRTIKRTNCAPPPFKNYHRLSIIAYGDTANIDVEKTWRECNQRSFNLGVENNIPRCCEESYNAAFRLKVLKPFGAAIENRLK